MRHAVAMLLAVIVLCCLANSARAGGGPQDVLLIMNARSSESLEIGNTYRRARAIPYRQVLTLNTSTDFAVSYQTYLDEIEAPIRTYLKNQQLEDQVIYLVLTRGIPQLVTADTGRATASLLATMNLSPDRRGGYRRLANPYLGRLTAFSHESPALNGYYLVSVLNGYNTQDITNLITQGMAADGTMPTGRLILQSSPQVSRDIQRKAANLLALRGLQTEVVTAPPADRAGIMAYLSGGSYSGITKELVASCTFLPGAIADLAQGFGAAATNFDESSLPALLPISAFVQTGITGVHGMVGEGGYDAMPAATNPGILLDRYTSGFSLAESFHAAIPYLNWQNVVMGDPLCAPYAQRPSVIIEPTDTPLTGTVPIHVTANSPTRGTSILRLDLYLDDRYLQTLYEPQHSVITLKIGTDIVTYPVPRGATLGSLLDNLAQAVNTHPGLTGEHGIRAVAQHQTGTLQLISRAAGVEGNSIPVAVTIESQQPESPSLSARAEGAQLSGGGEGKPIPARATLSFTGRATRPGDQVTVQILQEQLTYTVPEGQTSLTALCDALVALVEQSTLLQRPGGVQATRDDARMPFIVLQARTPGESGNTIPFQVSVKPVPGSLLRAFPDTPAFLTGGHAGTQASLSIRFLLGKAVAKGTALLDTKSLPDGCHRLRAIAYDGSPARVQGFAEVMITTANLLTPPQVTLPAKVGPANKEVVVPVAVTEAVKTVDLYVDGLLLGSATEAPFDIRIPLDALGRGTHDLWAVGYDADGKGYCTLPVPLEVVVPPAITRITPDHTMQIGGTTHRLIGTGFQRDSLVRLAGVQARSVTYVSPNVLTVVTDAGPIRRGWVEVTNPDGGVGTLPNGFEYYLPRVTDVQVSPPRDVVAPGQTARFTARCIDQFGYPMQATPTWKVAVGSFTPEGVYTAPLGKPGVYPIQVTHPDTNRTWETMVTVGPEEARDGYLPQWLVLGAFPDPDATGLAQPLLPDETAIQPSHGMPTDQGSWQSVYAPRNFIDLGTCFSRATDAVAYAHVYLYAKHATPCTLVFGSDDGIRLWLNGTQAFSLHVRRGADPNQNRLPVSLQAGWNRLLVKVDQGGGPWGFYMRMESPDGKPLTGITYALDRPKD